MKLTPEDRELARRMSPGVLCRDGFLGADARPPREIVAADRAALQRLGATGEELGAWLEGVCEAAMGGFGAPVELAGGRLTATFREAMGQIPCPWADGRRAPKGEVELVATATGRTIVLTPLSAHMIRAHGFWQGRPGRYRLEPREVVALFRLDRGRE